VEYRVYFLDGVIEGIFGCEVWDTEDPNAGCESYKGRGAEDEVFLG
jgi:hypothetical protein